MRIILFLTTILLVASVPLHAQVIKREYTGFTLWIDCAKRGPIMFEYRLGEDTGDIQRGSYKKDDQIEDHCEPTSAAADSITHPKVPTSNGFKYDGAT